MKWNWIEAQVAEPSRAGSVPEIGIVVVKLGSCFCCVCVDLSLRVRCMGTAGWDGARAAAAPQHARPPRRRWRSSSSSSCRRFSEGEACSSLPPCCISRECSCTWVPSASTLSPSRMASLLSTTSTVLLLLLVLSIGAPRSSKTCGPSCKLTLLPLPTSYVSSYNLWCCFFFVCLSVTFTDMIIGHSLTQLMKAWNTKGIRGWKPCANTSLPRTGLFPLLEHKCLFVCFTCFLCCVASIT